MSDHHAAAPTKIAENSAAASHTGQRRVGGAEAATSGSTVTARRAVRVRAVLLLIDSKGTWTRASS